MYLKYICSLFLCIEKQIKNNETSFKAAMPKDKIGPPFYIFSQLQMYMHCQFIL